MRFRSLLAASSLVIPALALGIPSAGGLEPVPADGASAAQPEVESVVLISVDGLSPDALAKLGRKKAPGFHALMKQGASTLNARTAHELTVTLPNHTGMVTSRRIDAGSGGHGVTWNDDRTLPSTVQAAAGGPVSSVFTQVAAAGGSASVFSAKTKFSLWQRSWTSDIDKVTINEDNSALVKSFIADLSVERDLRFLHISLPDVAGHAKGYMSKSYLKAVKRSSALVAQVTSAVNASAAGSQTAIILTADHGGGKLNKSHSDRHDRVNYRIPMMVVGPGIKAGSDLYALNPDYKDPGTKRPGYGPKRQPIRNAAVGNLALDLLGLAAIPGSNVNAAQNLDVSAG